MRTNTNEWTLDVAADYHGRCHALSTASYIRRRAAGLEPPPNPDFAFRRERSIESDGVYLIVHRRENENDPGVYKVYAPNIERMFPTLGQARSFATSDELYLATT